jgi:PAS domain S-box-containing protein
MNNIQDQLFSKILDNTSDALILVDASGKVVYLNASANSLQSLHIRPLQVGNAILESVRTPWKNIVSGALYQAMLTGKPSSFDTEYQLDGRRITFDVCCIPISSDGSDDRFVLVQMRDITLQKIFENKVGNASREIRELIDYANALIIGMDTGGYITDWNRFASEVIGHTSDESLTRHFSDVIVDFESQQALSSLIVEAMSGEPCSNVELSIKGKNSRNLSLLISTTARRNSNNDIIGILIIGQDVTELTAYRRSLEKKVRERTLALEVALGKEKELVEIKNRFVSIASHEFRSPISVIDAQVDAIKQLVCTIESDELTVRLEKISQQAKHMSALLEDVLLIGKSEAGKINANFTEVDLVQFLEGAARDVAEANNNTHRIVTKFPKSHPVIASDENILRNVFINLLTNAIKFSPGQNEVFLEINTIESGVEVVVIDQGIGIPERDIDDVFKPFNRATNAKNIKGTGLGLSIVKKAIDVLHGQLWVESQEGKGSKFTVQLKSTHAV